MGGVGTRGLGSEVDKARVLDIGLDMLGAGGAVDGAGQAGGVGLARCGLPVHQLDVQVAAFDAAHQDALRPQSSVVQATGVGVLQHFSDLAHELQALADAQALTVIPDQVVEPHRLGVAVEDQRGAELGVLVLAATQDAGVVDALEDFELALRLPDARLAFFGAGGSGQVVNADAALDIDADVPGLPLLEGGAVHDQLTEQVISDMAVLVRGPDASLCKTACDGAGLLGVDRCLQD